MASRAPSLERYRKKRDFARTPEPPGKSRTRSGNSYVIQKHAARRLHYDFRLELDGVLLSWAVPKGPSLDPKVKRLAVQTEDHPVEYGGFEGTIPRGEYGGGTVMVWDRGTWNPEGDARKAYRSGRMTFSLAGEKLRGRWHLVRTRTKDTDDGKAWLLFKSDDSAAQIEGQIVDQRPDSALTGRTMEQIADSKDRVWHSKPRGAGDEPKAARSRSNGKGRKEKIPELELTNPDKVLFPENGITKSELADYYAKVSGHMLPHVAGRPLTLVRCPEGRHKGCFFQKHIGAGTPEFVREIPIREDDGVAQYMAIDDVMGLMALVQLGVLEIHTWGASREDVEHPDLLVIDLDPDPAVSWERVTLAARLVRDRFEALGLESFVKTTGGKGLHICAPVAARLDWAGAKELCKRFAELIVHSDPKSFVATISKSKRRGKIFVDYLRNGRGATFIAPYSTRARPGAPVATPLDWSELDEELDPLSFDVRTLPDRLRALKTDPWARVPKLHQEFGPEVARALGVSPVKSSRRRAASVPR
jgi:bifunctional non-homologous end joining protein LigD